MMVFILIRNLRWWIGGLLFASTVINYIDRQTLSVLAPTLKDQYHWTNTDFATVLIAFRHRADRVSRGLHHHAIGFGPPAGPAGHAPGPVDQRGILLHGGRLHGAGAGIGRLPRIPRIAGRGRLRWLARRGQSRLRMVPGSRARLGRGVVR